MRQDIATCHCISKRGMLESHRSDLICLINGSEYPREGWEGCFGEQGKKGRAKARASGSKSIGKPLECGIGAAGEPETEVVY